MPRSLNDNSALLGSISGSVERSPELFCNSAAFAFDSWISNGAEFKRQLRPTRINLREGSAELFCNSAAFGLVFAHVAPASARAFGPVLLRDLQSPPDTRQARGRRFGNIGASHTGSAGGARVPLDGLDVSS